MKKFFTLFAFAVLSTVAAMAQKVALEGTFDKTTKVLTMTLNSEVAINGISWRVYAPEGMKVSYSADDEDYVYGRGSILAKKNSVDVQPTKSAGVLDGGIQFAIYGAPLKAMTGDVMAITLEGEAAKEDAVIKITRISFAEDPSNKSYEQADFEVYLKPDAISGVEAAAGDKVIFNVAGQRLNKIQKGINIVNGKKVLF